MEAVLYSRFSPRPDADTSESSAVQLDYCRQWCEANGHTIIAELDDPDASGDDHRRPSFRRALRLARGKLLVVYRKDRLVRSMYLTEKIHRIMKKRKITLHCVSGGNHEETVDGTLHRHIHAAIDQWSKGVTGQRTSDFMLRYQREGRLMSRHPPYGMKLGTPKEYRDFKGVMQLRKTLVPNHDELAAMRWMADLQASGKSLGAIADALNAKGGKWLCRGGKWTRKGVSRALLALEHKQKLMEVGR